MKKILALTLALMLALSLTAALAASKGNNTVPLSVNVTSDIDDQVTTLEDWDVDISAASLTWNLHQVDIQTGEVSNWDSTNDKYTDEVDHEYTTTLESGKAAQPITVTNNSNFDVISMGVLTPETAFASALAITGNTSATLVNKSTGNNKQTMTVTLTAASVTGAVTTGAAGTVTISLIKSGENYDYVP